MLETVTAFRTLISAPFSIKNFATSISPREAAQDKGVFPYYRSKEKREKIGT